MHDPIEGYDAQGAELAARYERMRSEEVHSNFVGLLPPGDGRSALDIGAGSGRDAAWLHGLGFDVVAVEPARGMREAGNRHHPEANIRWLDDRLPALTATQRLNLAFDVVLLSGVLMHVPPAVRSVAFRNTTTLLKPNGLLLITVRDGEGSPDRKMWSVARCELEGYAHANGLKMLQVKDGEDLQGREVQWSTYALQLPAV